MQHLKILILTTEPQWKNWDRKLSACRGGLGLTKNIDKVTIDLEPFTANVPVTEQRVDRAWFNTLTLDARNKGYHAVVLHMGEDRAHSYGIKEQLRGSTINDEQIGEMYVMSDEFSKVVYPSGLQVDRFIKVFLHEMSHWMAKRLGQEDKTHYWDYEQEAIWKVMSSYTWKTGIFDSILRAVRTERMQTPLATWEDYMITQLFGVKNPIYKSGIHSGIDLRCVVGTSVYAPTDGHITAVWRNSTTLGNACLFEFYHNGNPYTMRIAHLKDAPRKGGYRRGSVIAKTGNTGKSTGPHLHIELFKGGYEYDVLLREDTIRERMLNPFVFFKLYSNI